jgi:hypothetical protein
MAFLPASAAAVTRAELTRAEMAALLDVEILGQRRERDGVSAELLAVLQDDLGAIVIFLHFAANLDHSSGKLTHVADSLQVVRKDDDRKAA